MKISINENHYTLDLTSVVNLYRRIYETARTNGIVLSTGKLFVMNNQSLMRSAMKIIITPVVLPMLRTMYEERGLELEAPQRHADLIDFCVYKFLDLAQIVQEELRLDFQADEINDYGYQRLVSVTSTREDRKRNDSGYTSISTSSSNNGGRETLDIIRKNRNGEDTIEEGSDTLPDEIASPLE